MSLVYGYLFEWDGFTSDEVKKPNSMRFKEALLSLSAFQGFRSVRKAPRWSVYKFMSSKPLNGEELHSLPADFRYSYEIYVRVNERTKTVVIAASRYTITEEAVRTFNTYLAPNLQRKIINIKELSEHLLEKGNRKQFAVTYLLADVPGYGSALSLISLIGEDIGSTDFLDDQRNSLTTRQIGVRPIDNRTECGRFASIGSVQFRTDQLGDLEAFLSYAYQNGFYLD